MLSDDLRAAADRLAELTQEHTSELKRAALSISSPARVY
jgi:hypothetical protein